MAGLQSENISIASTRLPGQSALDKDVCVFCRRRATPPLSDPHAPLFPFFSLVDCRHYACQPCALVHCDNAGRCIFCPTCNCVSRLAQSGRRRTRSAAAAEADRVAIDDGVSSTRSRRTSTGVTPHRSALKGKSGSSKRRASSVQFPVNPATSIISGDAASDADGSAAAAAAAVGRGNDGATAAAEEPPLSRERSPLTQDAVDAIPLAPVEARRQRVREQQLRRAADAAAQAAKAVSLYSITAAPPLKALAPPPPVTTAPTGAEGRRSTERSRSQPAPTLPKTILEPKQVFPLPPPLVLHTVDEDVAYTPEAAAAAAAAATNGPAAAAAATATAVSADDGAGPGSASSSSATALVSVSQQSTAPHSHYGRSDAAEAGMPPVATTATATVPAAAGGAELVARPRQLLDDCEHTEGEERGVVEDVEAHARAALRQRMEEEDIAIRARRGLGLEFDATPAPLAQRHTHQHTGTLSLGEFSDQVSATSDDELSQRASAHKSAAGSTSTHRRRRRTSPGGASEPRTHAVDVNSPDTAVTLHKTAEGTLSPMTAARNGRPLPADGAEEADEDKRAAADAAAAAAAELETAAAAAAAAAAATAAAAGLLIEAEAAERAQIEAQAAAEAAGTRVGEEAARAAAQSIAKAATEARAKAEAAASKARAQALADAETAARAQLETRAALAVAEALAEEARTREEAVRAAAESRAKDEAAARARAEASAASARAEALVEAEAAARAQLEAQAAVAAAEAVVAHASATREVAARVAAKVRARDEAESRAQALVEAEAVVRAQLEAQAAAAAAEAAAEGTRAREAAARAAQAVTMRAVAASAAAESMAKDEAEARIRAEAAAAAAAAAEARAQVLLEAEARAVQESHAAAEARARAESDAVASAAAAAAARAADEARAVAEDAERARQWRQRQWEEEDARERQRLDRHLAFERDTLVERETLAREALAQAEAAVRVHYERSADEWWTASLPHELDAQRHARAAAERRRQQESEAALVAVAESAGRAEVLEVEANCWSWLLSGARVDRVVAATEEADRVQREDDEMRLERRQLERHRDTVELLREEAHGRASFAAYEAATRSLLQSHHAMQQRALLEDAQRQELEQQQKHTAHREAARRQRFQWELDALEADEVSGRAMLCEAERQERCTATLVTLQGVASTRRRELLAQHAAAAAPASAEVTAHDEASPLWNTPTSTTAHADRHTATAQSHPTGGRPRAPAAEDEVGDDDALDYGYATPPPQLQPQPQPRTPLITAEQLAALRAREAAYAAELQTALERLHEAERRVAEEAAVREQAEQQRHAAHVESERLLRDAEERAEQRIRHARDAAEDILQAQLADERDEAVRRAEHAAAMQALAEEEQRAVLEAKLLAAQQQLEEAQQRSREEVQRAREEAAEMAAADAARAAREAQRREDEWQERRRADHLLRLAEQESEKEHAIMRLADIEARAAEAVRLAREDAARTAAEAQERLVEMERRHHAREAEVRLASQRVRSAHDSLRNFDSHSQSSRYTTPSRAEQRPQRLSPRSVRHAAAVAGVASGTGSAAAAAHTPLQTPPLAPIPSRTSSAMPHPPSAPPSSSPPHAASRDATRASATAGAVAPHVVLSAPRTPVSSVLAHHVHPAAAVQPLPSSAAASIAGLTAVDPADLIRVAIRAAVEEIVEAQRRALSLRDHAEQHVERSERRYHRRQGDRLRAARAVAGLDSSYAVSDIAEAEEAEEEAQRLRLSARSARDARSWTRSSSTPASHTSPTAAPAPTASAAAAAAVPASEGSNTLLSTSSVYFDDDVYPHPSALGVAQRWRSQQQQHQQQQQQQQGRQQGLYGDYGYAAASQPPPSLAPYSAAARELFAERRPNPLEYDDAAAAAMDDRRDAHAGSHRAPPLQSQQQQQPARTRSHAGWSARAPAAHAYNEPEPAPPAPPATLDYSPPPCRSTTRAATATAPAAAAPADAEPHPQRRHPRRHAGAEAGSADGASVTGAGAAPELSNQCSGCLRTETTSACWRCGDMICRRCGLPPGSARKLCCTAHHRAQLREFARRTTFAAGNVPAAHAGARPIPSPLPPPLQSHPLPMTRGEQQVQTSFAFSAATEDDDVAAGHTAAGAARMDTGTSPPRHRHRSSPAPPPSLIPPAAYRAPTQSRHVPPPYQHGAYLDYTQAGAAAPWPPQPHPAYPAYATPYLYSVSAPPQLQHPSMAYQRYTVRSATAALGGGGPDATAAGDPLAELQRRGHHVEAVTDTRAPLAPPTSGDWYAAEAHRRPAGLAVSPPPPAALAAQRQREPHDAAAPMLTTPAMAAAVMVDGADAGDSQPPQLAAAVDVAGVVAASAAHVTDASPTPPPETDEAPAAAAAATSSVDSQDREQSGGGPAADAPATPKGDRGGGTAAAGAAGSGLTSSAAVEEPKTERKRTIPAFFVSLGDAGGDAAPRRPKPPTPRNFVPSHLPPPPSAAAAAQARGPSRRVSPSGVPLAARGRHASGPAAAAAPHPPATRKLSPYLAHEVNSVRGVRKSVSPAADAGEQRRGRRPSVNPHERGVAAVDARGAPPRKAQQRQQRQQRQHHHYRQQERPQEPVPTRESTAALTKSIKSYIKSLAPMVVVDDTGVPVAYEDVRKAVAMVGGGGGSVWSRQEPQRQERRPVAAGATVHDVYLSSADAAGVERPHRRGEAAQEASKSGRYHVVERPQPRSSSQRNEHRQPQQPEQQQQQQQQRPSRSGVGSYRPYSTSSEATTDAQSHESQHRYAPPHASVPMPAAHAAAPEVFVRRVPTLAELDRRLQQLRVEDEYEAAQHHRRQAQYAAAGYHNPQQWHQPHVHVLLHPSQSGAARDAALPAQSYYDYPRHSHPGDHHHSAVGRHPPQRTVSPPWRTDLNSSPVRPRWDISQPRSPIHHPAVTTAANTGS
ncbi:hypothetical protein NESM_000681300 [Novymonas esmeraldas]|uniref:RING-type domain-containing protein n=1 Tax=Novymonas esmeraldas TaxID=1808958 RepID=A0AAW0EUA0_9TRYP